MIQFQHRSRRICCGKQVVYTMTSSIAHKQQHYFTSSTGGEPRQAACSYLFDQENLPLDSFAAVSSTDSSFNESGKEHHTLSSALLRNLRWAGSDKKWGEGSTFPRSTKLILPDSLGDVDELIEEMADNDPKTDRKLNHSISDDEVSKQVRDRPVLCCM